MEYEDRITIWAPEGLALDYTLAGLGSRFLADLVDVAIRVIVLGAVIAILEVAGAPSTVVLIVFVVGAFLALFGYDIAFEVWAAGRTPGKRWNGLRVLMANGQSVTFSASAVRNLMRVIDIWATAMVVGSVSIIVTPAQPAARRPRRRNDRRPRAPRRGHPLRTDRTEFLRVAGGDNRGSVIRGSADHGSADRGSADRAPGRARRARCHRDHGVRALGRA